MPFSAFLARIRKLILADESEHYVAIERSFRDGSLHQPVNPMSDAELSEAIAEFTNKRPSDGSMRILNGRFNPKK
jgi:hypothetical protein